VLNVRKFYDQPGSFLKKWCLWATHSRLVLIIEAARHWDDILVRQ
jgi:hypothetical protein